MRMGAVLGITALVVCVFLYEWPRIHNHPIKDKWIFSLLLLSSWSLSVLLVFIPDLPGPTHLVEAVYKPLSKLLD